jgi:lipopolysaccharide export system protein LptA
MINFIRITLTLVYMLLPTLAMAEAADKDKPIELEADTVLVDDAKKNQHLRRQCDLNARDINH